MGARSARPRPPAGGLLNGDARADLDLTALWNQHEETGAQATLGSTRSRIGEQLRPLDIDSDGWCWKFRSSSRQTGTGLINAGTYVLEREATAAIELGREVSIETTEFTLGSPAWPYARPLEGYWMDFDQAALLLTPAFGTSSKAASTEVGKAQRRGLHRCRRRGRSKLQPSAPGFTRWAGRQVARREWLPCPCDRPGRPRREAKSVPTQ